LMFYSFFLLWSEQMKNKSAGCIDSILINLATQADPNRYYIYIFRKL